MSITKPTENLPDDLLVLLEPFGFCHVDGVPTSNDDAACQAIIDSYDIVSKARSKKDAEIQAERDRRREDGYNVGPYRFHSDPVSRTQIMVLQGLGENLPPGIQWKTKGTGYVELTPTLVANILPAFMAGELQLHAYGEQRRAQLAALQTLGEIQDFDAAFGWPAV